MFVPETQGKSREEVAELFKSTRGEELRLSEEQIAQIEERGRINQGANTVF